MAIEESKTITKNEEPQVGDLDAIVREIENAYIRYRRYRKGAARTEALYRGDGEDVDADAGTFKLLWKNTQTQRPLLYSNSAKPDIRRRFKEGDKAALLGSQLMERATETAMENPDCEFDYAMNKTVDDFLIGGRGTGRIVYNAKFNNDMVKVRPTPKDMESMSRRERKAVEKDESGPFTLRKADGYGDKTFEEAYLSPVHWRDYLQSDGHDWKDVWWVSFGKWMTRPDLRVNFGEEVASEVPVMSELSNRTDDDSEPISYPPIEEREGRDNYARVWEFWDKRTKTVYFIAEGYDKYLRKPIKDPLGLKQFFPCPRPLDMITTSGSLIPVAEYKMYEDQANLVYSITGRMQRITEAIVVRGIYDVEFADSIGRLFNAPENLMIPDDNFARLVASGSVKDAILWAPIEMLTTALASLEQQRQANLQIIHEIIGLTDVLRGQTNPREPYKTQKMKLESSSGDNSRMGEKRKEVERFARDAIRLLVEVIAEIFDPETVVLMASTEKDQATLQAINEILPLFRSDQLRDFKIQVESESTVAPDAARDKEELNEFMGALTSFIQAAAQAGQTGMLTPALMGRLLLFAVQNFKVGRKFEGDFEEEIKAQAKQAEEAQGQPSPEQMAAQAKQQAEQAKMELEKQKLAQEAAIEQEKLKIEWAKLQQDKEIDIAKIQEKIYATNLNLEVVRVNAQGGKKNE